MRRRPAKLKTPHPVTLPVLDARTLRKQAARERARALELCSDAEEVCWRSEAMVARSRVVKVRARPARSRTNDLSPPARPDAA